MRMGSSFLPMENILENIYGSALSDPPNSRPYDPNNKGYFRLFSPTNQRAAMMENATWTL